MIHTYVNKFVAIARAVPRVNLPEHVSRVMTNRHLRSQACFINHKKPCRPRGKKSICERVRRCGTCDDLITNNGESKRQTRVPTMCKMETGHLYYMAPLTPERHSRDTGLYVFYNLKPRREPEFRTLPQYAFRTSSAFNSFVRAAETNQTFRATGQCDKRKHTF
jgi:hypothetical protein